MKNSFLFFTLITIVVASVLVVACGGKPATSPTSTSTATSPTSISTATSPPPTSTATGTTAGELAAVGKTVYAGHCAKCHGDQGQGITGPVLIGASNTLDKYGTAQGLLNFIDTAMPLDAPGSLGQQDYIDLVAFLLVQNNYIAAGAALSESLLPNITLK